MNYWEKLVEYRMNNCHSSVAIDNIAVFIFGRSEGILTFLIALNKLEGISCACKTEFCNSTDDKRDVWLIFLIQNSRTFWIALTPS